MWVPSRSCGHVSVGQISYRAPTLKNREHFGNRVATIVCTLAVGTMICLIALLDHPFRGEVAVSPQAFELIYNQMMQE